MKTNIIREHSRIIEKKKKKFGVSDIVISAIKSNLNVNYFDFPNTIWLDVDTETEYAKLINMFIKSSGIKPFDLEIRKS